MNKYLFLLFIILFSTAVVCQQEDLSEDVSHALTPEDQELMDSIIRDFESTDPPPGMIRNIAEFEPMQGVLIRYNFGISYDLIAELSEDDIVYTLVANQSQQNTVTAQYNNNGVNLSNCQFIQAATDSYWTRDYGPWFISYGNNEIGIVNFPYNRPRPNDDDVPIEVGAYLGVGVFGMDIIHTGGNYMTTGLGISASSDLVITENPEKTISEIDSLMQTYLNVSQYHKIPDPNNTYIDHIDCWSKFLDVDKILIRSVPTSHAQYDEIEAVVNYFETQTSSYGTPYQVFRVYTPQNQPYTNSLILNDRVFVPVTGSLWDDDALASYEEAMPGYEILGFTGTWESTDALHCRTKGIADLGMLYIDHLPISGEVEAGLTCPVETSIVPFSGQSLISDSLAVHYRINEGSWNSVPLVYQDGSNYNSSLPAGAENDQIAYYITAADSSGRSSSHPFIGRADPHVFLVGPSMSNLQIEPGFIDCQLPADSTKMAWIKLTNNGSSRIQYSIETDSFRRTDAGNK